VTGNHGRYFKCIQYKTVRKIKKTKGLGKTFFNLLFLKRKCPRDLEIDKNGNPLKCKRCLIDEAKLREVENV